MKGIEYETGQKGLQAVLKDYQEQALKEIWANPTGLNSRKVHTQVNQRLKTRTISRASIINFLEDMREMGILKGEEKTGKGGHHWVYTPAMDESGFKHYIAETLIKCLLTNFPEETKKAIKQLN